MERKVYEIKGMDKCSLSTTYLGVKVNLEFKGGDIMSKKNGTLVTSNPFVQAAIESMPSFGKKIVLRDSYIARSTGNPVVSAGDDSRKPRLARVKPNAAELRKAKKTNDVVDDGSTIVEEVKNINDAVSYFMEKGEAVESKEQLEELMQKYNVVFPNMK